MNSKIELHDYQRDILSQLNQRLINGQKEIVIAACPSSGKTIMTLEFIHQNPTARFLILTHGTNVIKNMWIDELTKFGISFCENGGNSQVVVGLPHGFANKIKRKQLSHLGKVDYVIVDEAHEFTFAKMTQEVLKQVSPKATIFLTGTPSKFIKRGYEVICISALELIQKNFISDLYVGMVSTNANLQDNDYNDDGDVKTLSQYKLEQSVKSDLDELLEAIHKRLRETKIFKSSPNARKKVEWLPTLGKLQKTMIACKSIKQCQEAVKYFQKKKVNVISSESSSDKDSENITRFMKESDIKVLVVVDRGILGFNMPELVNVVDLTGSRNIDRIYQLYARVMRKHDYHKMKYFFKFSSEEQMLLMKWYMNAALCLMRKDFIQRYNGKNLNQLNIVEFKQRHPKYEDNNLTESASKEARIKAQTVCPDFYGEVAAGAFLIDIENKIGQSCNEYAYVTFGDILKREFGKNVYNVGVTLDVCRESARPFKNIAEWRKEAYRYYSIAYDRGWLDVCCAHMKLRTKWSLEKCKEIGLKYYTLSEFQKGDKACYLATQRNDWLTECTSHIVGRKERNKKRVIEFIIKNGRLPNSSKHEIKHKMIVWRYGRKSSKLYDANFEKQIVDALNKKH